MNRSPFFVAFLLCACLGLKTLRAQDSGALINALVRKGILSNQEAEDIRAELLRESAVVPSVVYGGAKSTHRLSVGGRLQLQYSHLDMDTAGTALDPAATNHVFLRRVYLTLKAGLGGDWGTVLTYDFAAAGYDDAFIEWKPSPDFFFNFGLRKVNVAYEERASSGNIRAIERSSLTRYFVESNNGRRLGAAGYRIGAFVEGKVGSTGLFYNVAITNPERSESFSLGSSSGDASNNRAAYWGGIGMTGKNGSLAWTTGIGAGRLPDQGGSGTANLGRGSDLSIYSAYVDVTSDRFTFLGEYLQGDVERGTPAGSDAKPRGYFLQPSVFVTESIEVVLRYSSLNTDGRGVTLADVIRSSPTGGVMNRSEEWYAGANLYLRGNDLKYQLGVTSAKTRETTAGAPAEAEALGVRSQLQVQF
jgi:hypothetical protein